jgi:hypothetical protein
MLATTNLLTLLPTLLGIPIGLAVLGFFGWLIWRFFFRS